MVLAHASRCMISLQLTSLYGVRKGLGSSGFFLCIFLAPFFGKIGPSSIKLSWHFLLKMN